MIVLLDHSMLKIAETIKDISYRAYCEEAGILGLDNFPPLGETVEDIIRSEGVFWGFYQQQTLAGVIECRQGETNTIDRLVVLPGCFRQGIASKLLNHALSVCPVLRVTTAENNTPAVELYKKFGFEKISIFSVEGELQLFTLEFKSTK